jgi:hypothetical protein
MARWASTELIVAQRSQKVNERLELRIRIMLFILTNYIKLITTVVHFPYEI